MASTTVQFLSKDDFYFSPGVVTTDGVSTNTTLTWLNSYKVSTVDLESSSGGTGTTAYVGGYTWTTTGGGSPGGWHEPEINGSSDPTLNSLAGQGYRFYSGNPNNPGDLNGGVTSLDIYENGTFILRLYPVYTVDSSGNRSAFRGYLVNHRAEYLEDQGNYTVMYRRTNNTGITEAIAHNMTMCFLAGTRIAVPSGETPVERLRVGDSVVTGNGPQLVSWISSSRKDSANFAPVVFTPAALASPALSLAEGASLPERPLKVSQQHCMVVTDDRARAFIGTDTFLLAAKHLINGDTIYLDHSAGDVEYFHLMVEQHQIVLAEGAWSESFYPGPEALKNLTAAQKQDIYEAAPDLMDDPAHGYGPTALPRLTGGEYKRLLQGKGPTPGQKLRRQQLQRVTADNMPLQASDLFVAGDAEITAMPVPPLVHRNTAAHSIQRH